jgi:hypothetical protein
MVVKVSKPEINVREKISELDKPSGTAGQAMLAAETPQEQFNLISAGRRNLIINGDQRIAQRGTSATGVVGSGYYINDRMHLGCSTNASGTYTLSQSTDAPAGFKNSFKLDCTTANSNPNQLRLNYQVEGSDVSHLNYGSANAQTLTLSFWVKSNVTGTYTLSIETSTAQRYFASHYTIDTANTWEYKTIQIVGDTANTISTTNAVGLTLSFWLTSPSSLKQGEVPNGWVTNSSYDTLVGSDFNVNMASSTSNEWMITGLQLELGKVATPFEHRSYGEELALCHRYYQKYGGGHPYHIFFVAGTYNSNTGSGYMELTGRMRAVPTVSSNGNFDGGNGYAQDVSLSNTFGMLEPDGTCKMIQLRVNGTGNNYLTGGFIRVRASNDTTARIILDAEL